MTKSKIQKWLKAIERQQDTIEKERDRLDDMIANMEDLKDDCYEAWEHLDNARDALSRLV